jgi:hypothetical protein
MAVVVVAAWRLDPALDKKPRWLPVCRWALIFLGCVWVVYAQAALLFWLMPDRILLSPRDLNDFVLIFMMSSVFGPLALCIGLIELKEKRHA